MSLLSTIFGFILPQKSDKAAIDDLSSNWEKLDGELAKTPSSVNGIPVTEGTRDVHIDEVPLAGNLVSSQAKFSDDTFIQRTSGVSAPINDGKATLVMIRGNMVRTGYVPESITMTVTNASQDNPITAVIDEDAFKEVVTASGTTTLYYTNGWSSDPAEYGITVTGTPINGDYITVVYVKENRGTITTAHPTSFNSTGWNLYDNAVGYAKVLLYSEEYGYNIEGSYTSLAFAATLTGTQTALTVIDGAFVVPSDGYVFVTGGDDTTCIYATWSDWQGGYDGAFEDYSLDTIDLTQIMNANFPNGLCRVGDVADEINFSIELAISRIERLAYTDANLELVQESGRAYIADTNYIYAVRETPVEDVITETGEYTVSDHGIEYFTGTTVACQVIVIYGNNLKNKLESDVLTISQQELSNDQKNTVCNNIGALRKPATDGTQNQILRNNGSGGTVWTDPATGEEVAAAVDAWLDENVPQDTTIAIDRSLTMSNAAAPADLVGDLKSAIGHEKDGVFSIAFDSETKTLNMTTGTQSLGDYVLNSNGTITSNISYTLRYMTVEKECKLFFTDQANYLAIGIWHNATVDTSTPVITGDFVKRYRNTDSNVPSTEDAAVVLYPGDVIVFNRYSNKTWGETATTKIVNYIIKTSESTEGRIETLETEAQGIPNKMTTADYVGKKDIKTIFSYLTESNWQGYVMGSGGGFTANAAFNSFAFKAKNDMDVYIASTTSSVTYIAFGVYSVGEINDSNHSISGTFGGRKTGDDLPSSENKYPVKKGDVICISTNSQAQGTSVVLGWQEDYFYLDESVQVTKDDSDNYEIRFGKFATHLDHIVNAGTRSDLWNIRGLTVRDQTIFTNQGDVVGVLKEAGQDDFMGGYHGDETNVYCHVAVDGKPVTTTLKGEQCDIVMYSHLTRVSTGDNVIDRFVHIMIRKNIVEIEVTFKCLVDNFNLGYAYNGGMFMFDSMPTYLQCNDVIIKAADVDHGSYSADSELISASALMNLSKQDAFISIENLVGMENEKYFGQVVWYQNASEYKVYFCTDHNSVWNAGHVCKGKCRWRLS